MTSKTSKKTPKKNGRPLAVINYAQLDKLCAIQCTGEECAAFLGMDYEVMNRAIARDGNGGFKDYYAKKSASGKISLRRRQFQAAEDGNPTMLVWLGKQWLGQSDKREEAEIQATQPLNVTFEVRDSVSDIKVTNAKS